MRVLLLCDGGGSLGVGHVMRSLALAEAAVAAGHEVVVAGRFEGSFLARQLAAGPVEVAHLEAPVSDAGPDTIPKLVRRFRPEVIHADSYQLDEPLLAGGISGGTLPDDVGVSTLPHDVVVSNMEDGTFGRRPADVVVDPTLDAELSPRPPDRSGWLLRGSRYTPVRQRVIDARQRAGLDSLESVSGLRRVGGDVRQPARSVLVVMGGTDPAGLAPVAVDLLVRTGLALEVTVIAVGENAQAARAAAEGSALSLNVLAPVDDLAALVSGQDLVISAAGTSVGELCCLGVPTAVIWTVDNQREGYARVVAAGAAIGLGGPGPAGRSAAGDEPEAERAVDLLKGALTDRRVRADLVLAGRHLVDGLGAWRVVRTWEIARRQKLESAPPSWSESSSGSQPAIAVPDLVARPATLADAEQLWEWRNDPSTRSASRSSAEVPWDDHLGWLADSLARTDRLLLVVADPLGDLGTVRWDRASEAQWEVSVTVAPQRRGQSLARPLLRAAEDALSEVARSSGTAVTAYLAVVHLDNAASTRLFETSGYIPDLPPDARGFMRYRKAARVP